MSKWPRANSSLTLSLLNTQVRCLDGHLGLSGMQVLLVPRTVSRLTITLIECLIVTFIKMLGLMFRLTNIRVNRPVCVPSLVQSKCRLVNISV